ncbi:MAG: carbamate kinase [Ignavibacteriaceae bacterium]|nr:carbamate kinase [Ignavibacteriaceae bacterium]NUM69544.1 carbamate kinase [Ignavibacteriaceae bacterium]
MKKIVVAALGGNALLRGHQSGTIKEQEQNAYDTCKHLLKFLWEDKGLVITHGNGPQVGNIMLRNEAGYDTYKIPKMPLEICVADSQGGIGYMIARQMRNLLSQNHINKKVITIVTEVLVDKNDPAFKNPSKPVGQFLLKEEADLQAKANGWVFREDPRKRGWRRVVASPRPVEILNWDIIQEHAAAGHVVIAVGGGGIPVTRDEYGKYSGIDAVIDKDLASSLLAATIGASEFYILTDVPKVYINFQKEDETALDVVAVSEAELYLQRGEFAAGSMGPKVDAALQFVKHSKGRAVITESNELNNPVMGTKIVHG